MPLELAGRRGTVSDGSDKKTAAGSIAPMSLLLQLLMRPFCLRERGHGVSVPGLAGRWRYPADIQRTHLLALRRRQAPSFVPHFLARLAAFSTVPIPR